MSAPHELPAPRPLIAPHSADFWAATCEERFLVGHCHACDQWFWPPTRSFCPRCGGAASLREAAGTGTIYSYTIVRVSGAIALGGKAYRDAVPYVLAYVELTEGPTMLTNIVGVDPEGVTIGLPVRLEFSRTGGPGDPALPRFRPAVAVE